MNIEKIISEPIFFNRNRVFRVYTGGMPYKEFFNDINNYDDGTDGYFPEEWVASSVKAINEKTFGERDGVSVVKDTNLFFDDLLENYKEKLLGDKKYDCLVKILDSSIRLPFQVHPTKDFSQKHFNSNYGKTEAWLVLATRPNAKIYFGFKDKMTKEFENKVYEQTEGIPFSNYLFSDEVLRTKIMGNTVNIPKMVVYDREGYLVKIIDDMSFDTLKNTFDGIYGYEG